MKLPALSVSLALLSAFGAVPLRAATLPPHDPLKILVISDEVNPNNLSDDKLTQRGDISAALNAPDSGLSLDGNASEVYSQCIDDALSALKSAAPPDVIVYFAHMAAKGCDASDQQAALTAAFEAHLKRGGGLMVLHHGGYTWPGKEALMPLLGVGCSSIQWNTTVGQRVFDVAPGHFITSNGVHYDAKAALTGMGDVPAGMFDYFDNIPDERYPATELLTEAGETRTVLFASDSGGTRVLGYALERSGWQGRVVFYQPAEYQPHALDDRAGPNFQILANSIVYSAHREGGGAGGANSEGAATSGASNGGTTSSGGVTTAGSGGATNRPTPNGGSPSSAGAAPGNAGSPASSGGLGGASSAGSSSGGASSGAAGYPSFDAPPFIGKDGCTCRLESSSRSRDEVGAGLASLLLGLGLIRRQHARKR